jgi:acetyl-CoA acetyltransferase
MIADPLRRADLCLESDGAAAVVVAGSDVASGCRPTPVRVLAVGQALLPGHDDLFLRSAELPPRPRAGWVTDMLAGAGVKHDDIDVIATYDAASVHVLFDVEALGFCSPGEGVDWATSPTVACNTSGGLLAEGYVQGMNHVVELVRQLRGEASCQVPGAEIALAAGPAVTAAVLLARGAR